MENGKNYNYYYEDGEYLDYYPMIITDRYDQLSQESKILGIYQSGWTTFHSHETGEVGEELPSIYNSPYTELTREFTGGSGETNYYFLPMRPVVILSGDTLAFSKDYIIEKMCEDVSSLYWIGENKLYDPNAVYKYYEKDEDGQWYYISYKGKQVLTEEEWNKKISELYDIENKKFKCNNMYYQKDEDGWYWISSSKNEKIYAGVEEEGIRKILDDFTEIVLVN